MIYSRSWSSDNGGMAYGGTNMIGLGMFSSSITTAVHETGHFLCKLNDEYVVVNPNNVKSQISGTNCRKKDDDFSRGGFSPFGVAEKDCRYRWEFFDRYYRPSFNSIMKSAEEMRFNAVSCGFCLNRILGNNNAITNMKECCGVGMNVIKPAVGCPTI